ncbi:LAGLIDADG family homing endonuclease [Streptomyces sp. NPDC093223]|uniref:LAGLIDADG family homing endonuclease n=1 Tax=Streptomyces sp. NPDC093223 TaxID=3366033 RepID=UPI0037FAC8CE
MDLTVPEYAYMFGFLQADGHLAQGVGRKGRLTVEINAKDVGLLRRFQQLTPYYRTALNDLGLPYGSKSRTVAPPTVAFARRDYLRGVVDADGSVGRTSKGFPFVSLTTASTAVAAYLCFYAGKVTGSERTLKRNARDDVYNVLYTKENAQLLAADLYYDGCLSLERKQAAADALSTWIRPAGMRVAPARRRWTAHEDRVLLRLDDDAAAAAELGRTEKSCCIRRWRLRTGRTPMPAPVSPSRK